MNSFTRDYYDTTDDTIECEACDNTNQHQNFCDGCGCCQECCNCQDTDCDCDVCLDRRDVSYDG